MLLTLEGAVQVFVPELILRTHKVEVDESVTFEVLVKLFVHVEAKADGDAPNKKIERLIAAVQIKTFAINFLKFIRESYSGVFDEKRTSSASMMKNYLNLDAVKKGPRLLEGLCNPVTGFLRCRNKARTRLGVDVGVRNPLQQNACMRSKFR